MEYINQILTESEEWMDGNKQLPQPSQQFIEQYIEEYNKGNIITDILVEYEDYQDTINYHKDIYSNFERLKINQDNTINIKSIKDSWNREEVENIIYKHTEMMLSGYRDTLYNWIKENL